jgi:small subunit ribosomal protein S21
VTTYYNPVASSTAWEQAGVVYPRPGESFDSLLRRFRCEVEESGVLRECRRRQYFVSPSELRRRKERRKKRLARQADTK